MDATWSKSSFSSETGCVETRWKSASECYNSNCVEVSGANGDVLVRDSKLKHESPVLTYAEANWTPRIEKVKAGVPAQEAFNNFDGVFIFNEEEWDKFERGVRNDEFDVPVEALHV